MIMVAQNRNKPMSTATINGETITLEELLNPTPTSVRGTPHWRNAPSPFCIPHKGWPTEAPPGTQEKLRVLEARHARDEELWHPYDATYDGDIRPLVFYIEYKERTENRQRI